VVEASRLAVKLIAWPYARFQVEAEAPLPDGPWVGIFNHASTADVAAMAHALDRPVGFWVKAELGGHPFLGPWLRACGGVFVRRGQRDEAAFREARDKVRAGLPFALAPEGTRRHGEGPPPLHTGFVRLALEAGVPVVPFVIAGARQVLPPGRMCPRGDRPRVRVLRLAPVTLPTLPADEEHRGELRDVAERLMAEVYRRRDQLEEEMR